MSYIIWSRSLLTYSDTPEGRSNLSDLILFFSRQLVKLLASPTSLLRWRWYLPVMVPKERRVGGAGIGRYGKQWCVSCTA